MSKEISQTRIAEVMQREVVTVEEHTTIKELKGLFDRHDFNAFPVVRDGRMVGMVTKLDFLRAFSMGRSISRRRLMDLWAEKVGDIMRRAVVQLGPEASVREAVEYMVEFKLRSLPVIEDGRLVGIVAMKDVLPHLMVDEG